MRGKNGDERGNIFRVAYERAPHVGDRQQAKDIACRVKEPQVAAPVVDVLARDGPFAVEACDAMPRRGFELELLLIAKEKALEHGAAVFPRP